LSRLIFYEEKALRLAPRFAAKGVRVCHVSYSELIGNTEQACRRICEFLGWSFFLVDN
jgi:hypothetical protein